VVEEETINARNRLLSEIIAERTQAEENIAKYKTAEAIRNKLLGVREEFSMPAAKTPHENFFQCVSNEIAAQTNRTHLLEMEIRKHKILRIGTETQQRLIGQQKVNQRTESQATGLFHEANAQLQQYQTRIHKLQQLTQ
jgi:hypothetical protein